MRYRKVAALSLAGMILVGPPAMAAGDQTGIVTWQVFFQQLLSSLKIDTQQASVTGEQISASARGAAESKISAVLQSRINMEIADAKQQFSYETGQGYNACMVSVGLADIKPAKQQRRDFGVALGKRDSDWLSQGGGKSEETINSIINLRKRVYCSQAEEDDLGSYCQTTNNGFDAGNSNAAVWLARRGYGAEEAMTGMDYVDTVAPLPTVPLKDEASAGDQMRRAEAVRAGVLRNAARTVLQNIILDGMSGQAASD